MVGVESMDNLEFQKIFGEFSEFKRKSSIIAEVAYLTDSWTEQGVAVAMCNNQFGVYEDGEVYGNFCRQRICPQCQRRLSLKTYALLQKVVKTTSGRWLMMTLTVRNVKAFQLDKTISRMFLKFSTMWREELKTRFDGCFRALEVTYNSERDDYHPHFHCLINVADDYFTSEKYLKQSSLVDMWQGYWCRGSDGGADLRVIDDKEKGVAEVAKYAVKPFDFNDEETAVKILDELFTTLRSRRLTQTYGTVKTALSAVKMEYKELEKKDPLDADKWYFWNGENYFTRR